MNIFGKKDNVITYTVNKEANNNIYITVQNGEVMVNAPWYYTSTKIQQIVEEKRNWIFNKLQEYKENNSNIKNVKIFGNNYDVQVNYKKIKIPELNLKENYIIQVILPMKYKKIGNEKVLKLSIEKMYEQIAKEEIEAIMENARKMLKFAPEDYEITKMEGVLGICENEKIFINPELMKYKKEIIEYVVIHEFCHLKYKSHGKRFYNIINKYVPEYKKYENAIKEYQY